MTASDPSERGSRPEPAKPDPLDPWKELKLRLPDKPERPVGPSERDREAAGAAPGEPVEILEVEVFGAAMCRPAVGSARSR